MALIPPSDALRPETTQFQCPVCGRGCYIGFRAGQGVTFACRDHGRFHGVDESGRVSAGVVPAGAMDPEERLWLVDTACRILMKDVSEGNFLIVQSTSLECNYAMARVLGGRLRVEVCSRDGGVTDAATGRCLLARSRRSRTQASPSRGRARIPSGACRRSRRAISPYCSSGACSSRTGNPQISRSRCTWLARPTWGRSPSHCPFQRADQLRDAESRGAPPRLAQPRLTADARSRLRPCVLRRRARPRRW